MLHNTYSNLVPIINSLRTGDGIYALNAQQRAFLCRFLTDQLMITGKFREVRTYIFTHTSMYMYFVHFRQSIYEVYRIL